MASIEREDEGVVDVVERASPCTDGVIGTRAPSSVVVVVASLGLMVFMVRVLGGLWPHDFKIFFPDSFSFLHVAKITPFSPGFYAAERPVAFPTLLFLMGRSTVLTVIVQTLMYGLAYIFAARSSARILQHRAARILAVFLLVRIALEPRFALWNSHILSESIGMTLAVFSLTTWWLFSADPTVRRLRWASIATIAWLTARDSNVPPWAAVGVPALLCASFFWKSASADLRRALRRWGVVTLVVCISIGLTQAANGRNRYATLNNVGQRILTDQQLTTWFVDQGMPMSDDLIERVGSNSFDDGGKMLNSPNLAEFRTWARGPGQREMLLSYVRFAPHWIKQLNRDLPVLLHSDQSAYDAFHVAARLPAAPTSQLGGPTTRLGLVLWIVAVAVALVIALPRRRVQSVVLGLLMLSCFIDVYIAYVGDSLEVQRHMVGPLSRMAVVFVLCICMGIDAALVHVRRGEAVTA